MLDKNDILQLSCLKIEPGIIRLMLGPNKLGNTITYKCHLHYDSEDFEITAIKGYCIIAAIQ